jgi:hypothetical protein
VDSSGLGYGSVTGCVEHGNENFGSRKSREFFDKLSILIASQGLGRIELLLLSSSSSAAAALAVSVQ